MGVTPFTMWGIRPPGLPALPLLSRSHELNVRTYVEHGGKPGVWFFSLDANSQLNFVTGLVKALLRFRPIPLRVRIDGEDRELRAMIVAVANAGLFGSR